MTFWKWIEKIDIDYPGCTLWPEGAWHDCCVAHDYAYADSRTAKEKIEADYRLWGCVSDRGYPITGFVMFVGVMTLGWIPWLRYQVARG